MLNIKNLPIFIVTLNGNTERQDRLKNRLIYFNLVNNTTFVFGYKADTELVKFYSYKTPEQSKIVSCTLNHFLCLRKFVETKEEYAMILEDDAIFHVDFINKVNELLKNPPKNLLLLGFTHGTEYHKSLSPIIGLNPITYWTGGCVAYIISRNYANKVLTLFDHPGINYLDTEKNTSEVISCYSEGSYINPPIILEEAVSSVVGHNTTTHLLWFRFYCNLSDFLIPVEDQKVVDTYKRHMTSEDLKNSNENTKNEISQNTKNEILKNTKNEISQNTKNEILAENQE
jgi:GR25 family glycosyltransferase involved in LPS biosynthesis